MDQKPKIAQHESSEDLILPTIEPEEFFHHQGVRETCWTFLGI